MGAPKADNPSLKRVIAQLPNCDRYGSTNHAEARKTPGGDGLTQGSTLPYIKVPE